MLIVQTLVHLGEYFVLGPQHFYQEDFENVHTKFQDAFWRSPPFILTDDPEFLPDRSLIVFLAK